jgi:hypothetical protein
MDTSVLICRLTAPQAIVLSTILFTFTAAQAQSNLTEALDEPRLLWTTGGHAPWFAQSTVTHDATDAARSGAILDSQETWLQTTVTGPGHVAFWWKISSEMDYDVLQFEIGGVVQGRLSGEETWQRGFFPVPAGRQTLRWRYVKDLAIAHGEDRAWLDEVAFVENSGPPNILAQPTGRTVAHGFSVTFNAGAAGEQPLHYQWFLNQTQAIPNATDASLTLTNIQMADAGDYSVVVSNLQGVIASSTAQLMVAPFGPITNVLLFAETSGQPYQTALTALGQPYQQFTSATLFNQAVMDAPLGGTLVIVDSWFNNFTFSAVAHFVKAGGRAVLQHWDLPVNSSLAAAFNAQIVQVIASISPVYEWGGSSLFAGVNSPIMLADLYTYDGTKLQPTAGGQAVAGFVPAAAPGQAAVILGNFGRTIIQGFVLEEANSSVAAQFARNAIESFQPRAPSIVWPPVSQTVLRGGSVRFSVSASGSAPLSYQWFLNATNPIPHGTNVTLSLTNVQLSEAGNYSVTVSNPLGAAASSLAVLTVTPNIPASTVFLLVDSTLTSPFQVVLAERGYPYQLFTNESPFNAALSTADAATTLVVIDAPQDYRSFTPLFNFLDAGGRAILQYWDLWSFSALPAAFNANVTYNMYLPTQPVHDWGHSALFAGVGNPINFVNTFSDVGEKLQPTAGGLAVAGWVATPAAAEAALVIGRQGRTILNGFALREIIPGAAAARLAANEVELLVGPAVPTPPAIWIQPQDQVVPLWASATFSVGASGPVPLRYQWFLNTTNVVPGATNATLTLPSVRVADAGSYRVVISNAYGAVTSRVATLTVQTFPPQFVAQPQNQTVLVGRTAMLSVSASGSPPLHYQWLFAQSNVIAGATNASLAVANVHPTNAGSYHVVVSNAFGAITSSPAVLTLLPLRITSQPQSQTVPAGSNVTLRVVVESTLPVRYLWHLEGTALPEATNPTLFLPNAQRGQSGVYTVGVSNDLGGVNSDPAILTVLTALIRPTIIQQPRSQTVAAGDTVTLGVAVTNEATLPVTYRWRKGSTYLLTNVVGQTTNFMILANVQTNQAGAYNMVATNLAGSVPLSSNAYLTVVLPPANQTVQAGSNATFTATAVGVARRLYQWQFNGADLADATNASLTLTNVQPTHAGTYAVIITVVTNVPVAPAAFPVALAVITPDSDTDGDGLPDQWETDHGLRPDDPSDASRDEDHDGLSNGQEYQAGTNPTNALSALRLEPASLVGAGRDVLVLQFNAVAHKSYTVQCRPALHQGSWTNWWNLDAQPTHRLVSTNVLPGSAAFYRLVTPRQP